MQILLEGLLLGLATGAYCMGSCLVFFMPYLLAEGKKSYAENFKNILFFTAGRLLAYLLFAVIVSVLGARYGAKIPPKISYFCLIAAALLLLGYVFRRSEDKPCMADFTGGRVLPRSGVFAFTPATAGGSGSDTHARHPSDRKSQPGHKHVWMTPFVLGVLVGLNPCVPFLAAAARVLTFEGIVKSAALFTAFFVGTSAYMVPLIFVSVINRAERARRVGFIMAILAGVWLLFTGIVGIVRS